MRKFLRRFTVHRIAAMSVLLHLELFVPTPNQYPRLNAGFFESFVTRLKY
jgi:hypothetical protein